MRARDCDTFCSDVTRGVEAVWRKKKGTEKESVVCATAFPRDRAEKEKPEIDMYSMPRRVQSIAGQAGGILSAV